MLQISLNNLLALHWNIDSMHESSGKYNYNIQEYLRNKITTTRNVKKLKGDLKKNNVNFNMN